MFIDYGNKETTNVDGASINVDYSEGAPCPYDEKYYTDEETRKNWDDKGGKRYSYYVFPTCALSETA